MLTGAAPPKENFHNFFLKSILGYLSLPALTQQKWCQHVQCSMRMREGKALLSPETQKEHPSNQRLRGHFASSGILVRGIFEKWKAWCIQNIFYHSVKNHLGIASPITSQYCISSFHPQCRLTGHFMLFTHTHQHEYGWFWGKGHKTHPEIPLFSKPTWPKRNIFSFPGLCADCNQGTSHSMAENSPSFRALLRNLRQNSTPTAIKVCSCQRLLVLPSQGFFVSWETMLDALKKKYSLPLPNLLFFYWILAGFGVWAEEHVIVISLSKILFLTYFF